MNTTTTNTATTSRGLGSDRGDLVGGFPTGLGDPSTASDRSLHPSTSVSASSWSAGVAGFTLALGGVALGGLALLGLPVAGLLGGIVSVTGIVLCVIGLGRGRARRGLAVAGLVIALLALPVDAVGVVAVLSHLDTASTVTTTGTYSAGSGGRVVENAAMVTDISGGSDLYWRDQTFLQILTEHGVFLDAGQQAPVVGLGHQVAIYMTQGGTVDDAVRILVSSGWSSYDANIIVGDAIGSYLSTTS